MCFHENHIFIQLLLRSGHIRFCSADARKIVYILLSQNNVTIGFVMGIAVRLLNAADLIDNSV
jgi:hypothetical protein